jgi:hypothetical protein
MAWQESRGGPPAFITGRALTGALTRLCEIGKARGLHVGLACDNFHKL